MEEKKLSKEDYDFVYNRVPRLCVDIVIKDREGNILLIERDIDPGKGMWHFPGGTVLKGESLDQAIKRIVKEEANLDIIEISLLGTVEFNQKENPYFHTVSLVHEVKVMAGEPKGGFQGENVEYFNVMPDKIIPEQGEFIKQYNLLKR